MTKRVFNFNSGPAVLPLPVLEEVQRDLMALPGVGMSILELTHRSKTFDRIIRSAESSLRELLGIPNNYNVLFLHGGASLQFSMVPMNLLAKDKSADYIVTGTWSKKAVKEAQRVGTVNIITTPEDSNFSRIPQQDELKLDDSAAYVHITTNNTIFGTEWKTEPSVGNVPLIADASSNILSRPIPIKKYALIYAGAQKNIGTSGVALAIVRDDLLDRIPDGLPVMLDYRTHIEHKSLYNTPNTFGIYIISLVCQWLQNKGGLAAVQCENEAKAKLLYDVIDGSDFYRGHADTNSRSMMNVTFRLPSEELEELFVEEAAIAGFEGLKGHRSVSGLRASIYNAFPREGVEALVSFMKKFEQKYG
ncbi:3-phosphoserine/phosphohydroxythreonine transaminase [Nostoc sp.]|uniref:3-phosphoserine/phosphohydroxythreonine transaminase n=1 Tax=Nostoc sp. TaxID=1180 RepID=UPI002FFBCC90